jgi:hypothetical protein
MNQSPRNFHLSAAVAYFIGMLGLTMVTFRPAYV